MSMPCRLHFGADLACQLCLERSCTLSFSRPGHFGPLQLSSQTERAMKSTAKYLVKKKLRPWPPNPNECTKLPCPDAPHTTGKYAFFAFSASKMTPFCFSAKTSSLSWTQVSERGARNSSPPISTSTDRCQTNDAHWLFVDSAAG